MEKTTILAPDGRSFTIHWPVKIYLIDVDPWVDDGPPPPYAMHTIGICRTVPSVISRWHSAVRITIAEPWARAVRTLDALDNVVDVPEITRWLETGGREVRSA